MLRLRAVALVLVVLITPIQLAALSVVQTTPAQNAIHVPQSVSIAVTLDDSIDGSTADSAAIIVRGNMSGLHPGVATVIGNELEFDPDDDFAVGDLVTVVIKRDLKSLSGDSLVNGFFWSFTIQALGGTGDLHVDSIYGGDDIPYYIYGGDLDEDGDMDIATPNEGSENVTIYSNLGGAKFSAPVDYPTGTISSSVYGDDFDNDGDQDLAVANKGSSDVSVLLNLGDGTFGPQTIYDAGLGTQQIYGGDFDNDGDMDLATSQRVTDDLRLFFNAGDGTFDSILSISYAQADPNGIFGGDFNNDGYFDLAAANQNFSTMTVVLGNGDGTFSIAGSYPVGASTMMYGSDFDGDNDLDIVATNNFLGMTAFAFNDGIGGFDSLYRKPAGTFPLAAWSGDLDADGDMDAMVSNFQSGDLSYYENLGGGVFGDQTIYPLTDAGSFVWFHDLDGDGDLDVSAIDEIADLLYIFVNCPCADFTTSPRLGEAPLMVAFSDASISTATTRLWQFGDGDTSTAESPTHVYSPGIYDVRFEITTPDGSTFREYTDHVTVWADTMNADTLFPMPGTVGFWTINGVNALPLTEIILPVMATNAPAVLELDSVSLVGTRTEYFENLAVLFDNGANGQYAVRATADAGGGAPPLPPGIGPIARVYFHTSPSALGSDSSMLHVQTFGSVSFETETFTTTFTPVFRNGLLTIDGPVCECPLQADFDANGFLDAVDLNMEIDALFFGGIDPQDSNCPRTRADFNADGFPDAIDLNSLIDHLFFGGPPPIDPCAN